MGDPGRSLRVLIRTIAIAFVWLFFAPRIEDIAIMRAPTSQQDTGYQENLRADQRVLTIA